MKKDYELLSFIQGSRRKSVLSVLNEGVKTPKEIAEKCKISISNVSNTLSELVEKKLVICKNPNSHIYKYYEITNRGKELLKEIDKH
ncbi:winged helix-turn-helix transcriptional regulator [Candidatus Woesearchaeota archaeon]|nr:winged helix-turn-helix transcriptional regulator [Candidatus Woesearchaeota archaeon]